MRLRSETPSGQGTIAANSRSIEYTLGVSKQRWRAVLLMLWLSMPLDAGRQKHQSRLSKDGITAWLYGPSDLPERLRAEIDSLDLGLFRGILQAVDYIYRHNSTHHISAEGWVGLHSKILEKRITRWGEVKRILLRWGVIEEDSSYEKGKRCKRYRFAPEWRSKTFSLLGYRDKDLFEKYQAGSVRLQSQERNSVVKWLYNTLKLLHVDWDSFEVYRQSQIDGFCKARKRYGELSKGQQKRENRLNRITNIFREIELGQIWFIVDLFSGRIHTSLTSLPKEARRFLRGPNGERLVELDVSCSQPLIATAAARRAGYDCPELYGHCRTGEIYDLLQRGCCLKSRDRAKKLFVYCLFRDPDAESPPAEGWLRANYARFFEWVDCVKNEALQQRLEVIRLNDGEDAVERFLEDRFRYLERKKSPEGKWKIRKGKREKRLNPGGQELARQMQTMEREIVITPDGKRGSGRGLCWRLWKHKRGMFVATIHDCLVVLESEAEEVKEWFHEEFRHHGIEANIKIAPLI